jgi:ubiquitin-like 1-activating enzyme E1 B
MAAISPMLASVQATLGPEMLQMIQNSKILLVGAGGIGCELLKNLAFTGFRHVTVIDLDTIDVSNLNRQLLFRTHHVGQPKCTVAAQVASQMVPLNPLSSSSLAVQYTAHHANVCDSTIFDVQFVQTFHLVLNALDNVVARRRVNRLCLAADVPLVEAGTTGYLGQVNVIHKNSDVACYECHTQETQKVYPICTIRSTPSMPVHTIVWAKELYKLLFGEKVEESMLYEDPRGEETSTYMKPVLDFRDDMVSAKRGDTTTSTSTVIEKQGLQIITALYVTEIQKQLDMDRYKTASKTPKVLSADALVAAAATPAPTKHESYRHTDLWSPAQCVAEFIACLQDAWQDPAAVLSSFDKDDAVSMRLVTAASNLRSHVFQIEPLQSYYSAKGIAGNIIPAIATTNAICAGLQILQAFCILRAQLKDGMANLDISECCSYVNCLRNATRNGLYLTAAQLEEPNPNCFVCKSASVSLALDTTKWTLGDFLNKICKADLGFEEPTLFLSDGGDCIWEEGQDADQASFAANLVKRLPELRIRHGTFLTIEDFSQNLEVNVTITHQDVWEASEGGEPDEFEFVIGGTKPVVAHEVPAPINGFEQRVTNGNNGKGDDSDDFIEFVEDDAKKRPLDEADDPASKKQKVSSNGSGHIDTIDIS